MKTQAESISLISYKHDGTVRISQKKREDGSPLRAWNIWYVYVPILDLAFQHTPRLDVQHVCRPPALDEVHKKAYELCGIGPGQIKIEIFGGVSEYLISLCSSVPPKLRTKLLEWIVEETVLANK